MAGYTHDGNTSNVDEMLKSLNENASKFAEVANVQLSDVKTDYVTSSSRYKNMRIFYAKVDSPPAIAFEFPKHKMGEYIYA